MHPLEQLEFPSRVAKRAQYEAFEFTLSSNGVVVRNGSHANPAEHEYLVTVEDSVPAICECPADKQYDSACKHRVAVAIRRPLLDAIAVTDESQPVAADGGQVTSSVGESDTENDSVTNTRPGSSQSALASPDDEDCPECLDDFPCWECVRTGRRDLPE
ncbi:SWIM zinc finger family protein [Halosimplex pelagicum]|uniref:SWIM zinc finger family protein n=1 Tax=Halosimplex pelagicum TaxID=869886 RepID=A0A7D5P7Q4_9EURY|nr:SWIM zinc finger family protein [Halosimplex pelagicum]QLH81301.1 SWIM zinc finger family protein [Halosimplex pelagicum]